MTMPPATRAGFFLVLAALAGGCSRETPDGVALVGATVWDGTTSRPQPGLNIIVRNDRVEAVGTPDEVPVPRRMRTVDLTGKFVMPGLIDGHVHVRPWTLDRFLVHGVTSVRDMHGTLDTILRLRERANLNAIMSPRIFSAGAMIDGTPPTFHDALAVSGTNDARKAVDLLAVKGVDYVKVYTRVTPEQVRAITDEAQTFGLKVAAHLGVTDAVTAADMGVKAIEHLSGVPEAILRDNAITQAHRTSYLAGWTASEKAWARVDSASLARVASRLVEDKVTLIPTMVLHETFSRLDDPAVARSEALKAVPDSEMTRWDVPGMVSRAGWTSADFAAFRTARANQDLFVRIFRSLGGRVVAGTDAAGPMLVPGASLARELELLVQVGFTPMDALLSATRDAATLLGADSIGTISPGRKADLIVLSQDPTEDIGNIRTVEQVMVRGQLMPVDSLRRRW